MDPTLSPHQYALRERSDGRGRATIGFRGAFGIAPQEDCRIVPATGGHDVHWNARVEQRGFVASSEVMEAEVQESKLAVVSAKFRRDRGRWPATPVAREVRVPLKYLGPKNRLLTFA